MIWWVITFDGNDDPSGQTSLAFVGVTLLVFSIHLRFNAAGPKRNHSLTTAKHQLDRWTEFSVCDQRQSFTMLLSMSTFGVYFYNLRLQNLVDLTPRYQSQFDIEIET